SPRCPRGGEGTAPVPRPPRWRASSTTVVSRCRRCSRQGAVRERRRGGVLFARRGGGGRLAVDAGTPAVPVAVGVGVRRPDPCAHRRVAVGAGELPAPRPAPR